MGQVSLKSIHKQFGDHAVIRGVDLEVQDGEFLVCVGPSGCGKSTILRMIAGLESISSGDLLIDGQRVNDIHPAERGAAMVFQSYALYPHMTVAENMEFSLKMSGMGKAQRQALVASTAATLKMTELLGRFPKELSGGQRQRVAIGRAIVRKPKVFLFDEPLSNLDAALRVNMRIELSRLHKELGTTMIYVTHDQVEAMTMGDRIAIFNQGLIEQVGTPMQLYKQPANEFVASFLGAPAINLIKRPVHDGAASAADTEHQQLWQSISQHANAQTSKIGVRPEHLRLLPQGQGIDATVVLAEHLGDSSIVHLRVKGIDTLLNAKINAEMGHFDAGQAVGLAAEAAHALPFDGNGKRQAANGLRE
jgi:multiple sugar transport system ATP-binding protein